MRDPLITKLLILKSILKNTIKVLIKNFNLH
jgi:hypothetical protein